MPHSPRHRFTISRTTGHKVSVTDERGTTIPIIISNVSDEDFSVVDGESGVG